MNNKGLTEEQAKFFEGCMLEFTDRYTDADPEYKKVYEADIPKPPIMYPWHGRRRSYGNRERTDESHYNQYSQRHRGGLSNHNRGNEREQRFHNQNRSRPY